MLRLSISYAFDFVPCRLANISNILFGVTVICPPFSLDNTRFPFQAAILVFFWQLLEHALMT
jgi:hypothetical protein